MDIFAHGNTTPSLLRLPPDVRRRIYAAADILDGDVPLPQSRMSMNFRYWGSTYKYNGVNNARFLDLRAPKALGEQERTPSEKLNATQSLLLTCRTVYEEVADIVYSTNSFYLRCSGTGDLSPIFYLRSPALRALRQLTLLLNDTSCFLQPCERARRPWNVEARDPDTDTRQPRQFSRPWDMSVSSDAISTWHRLWRDHLQPMLSTPGQLDLSLVCDVADYATGRMVVQPLLETPRPCVAKCRIRLSAQKDHRLQILARQAVEAVVSPERLLPTDVHHAETATFRFLDLPPELRQQVLQYTDLVTRSTEVEWNPRHRQYYCRPPFIEPRRESEVPSSTSGAENVFKNQGCWRPEHLTSWVCWEQSFEHGCFCTSYHAAFSNVVQCRCWAPPTALFLVCHAIRQDALKVFFSSNRFVIAPESVDLQRVGVVDTSPSRLAPSIFLSEVVPKDGLRHIRFLDIQFPAFGDQNEVAYCSAGSTEERDWIDTLNSVKRYLTLPKLTVRVQFSIHPSIHPSGWGEYRKNMTPTQRQTYKDCYVNTISPLKIWRGMEKFHVHLPDPQNSCWWEGDYNDEALEKRVEKIVMGDDYESTGKADLEENLLSLWDGMMYGE